MGDCAFTEEGEEDGEGQGREGEREAGREGGGGQHLPQEDTVEGENVATCWQ